MHESHECARHKESIKTAELYSTIGDVFINKVHTGKSTYVSLASEVSPSSSGGGSNDLPGFPAFA